MGNIDPKASEIIYLACKTKTPVEFVGRVLRAYPSIRLGQLVDLASRHFDLTPKEYSQVEEDFVRFSKLKKVVINSLKSEVKDAEDFVKRFFEMSSSGGLEVAASLVSEAYGVSTEAAKELSGRFSTLAYTKLAGYQKGFKRTASLPMYDWNILDPVWEMVEKGGTLMIVRKEQ